MLISGYIVGRRSSVDRLSPFYTRLGMVAARQGSLKCSQAVTRLGRSQSRHATSLSSNDDSAALSSAFDTLQRMAQPFDFRSIFAARRVCIARTVLWQDVCRSVRLSVCLSICHTPAIDSGDIAALCLLDLSAAFDTVDHSILLRRLQRSYGLNGSALVWFGSYLNQRQQHVTHRGVESATTTTQFGVPQGSVLGPILFVLYTADVVRQYSCMVSMCISTLMTRRFTAAVIQTTLHHCVVTSASASRM